MCHHSERNELYKKPQIYNVNDENNKHISKNIQLNQPTITLT